MSMATCGRCERPTDKLYPMEFTDDEEITTTYMVCWDCDWEVTNGHDFIEDSWEIDLIRQEEDYEYDPINNVQLY